MKPESSDIGFLIILVIFALIGAGIGYMMEGNARYAIGGASIGAAIWIGLLILGS